jgi:hypothetical protein
VASYTPSNPFGSASTARHQLPVCCCQPCDTGSGLSFLTKSKAGSVFVAVLIILMIVGVIWGCLRKKAGKSFCCCSLSACLSCVTCGRPHTSASDRRASTYSVKQRTGKRRKKRPRSHRSHSASHHGSMSDSSSSVEAVRTRRRAHGVGNASAPVPVHSPLGSLPTAEPLAMLTNQMAAAMAMAMLQQQQQLQQQQMQFSHLQPHILTGAPVVARVHDRRVLTQQHSSQGDIHVREHPQSSSKQLPSPGRALASPGRAYQPMPSLHSSSYRAPYDAEVAAIDLAPRTPKGSTSGSAAPAQHWRSNPLAYE